MVKRIVDNAGGKIEVESEEGVELHLKYGYGWNNPFWWFSPLHF